MIAMNPRFPNGACMSSSAGKNGTCYAEDECKNKGGTGYGSCAGGYGVCCVCKSESYIIFPHYSFCINWYSTAYKCVQYIVYS